MWKNKLEYGQAYRYPELLELVDLEKFTLDRE